MYKLAIATIAAASSASAGSLRGSNAEWDAFVSKFGFTFTAEELVARRAIFDANLAKIEAHNALNLPWTMGVNQFTHLTPDEWRARVSSGKRNKLDTSAAGAPEVPLRGTLPASVNWTAVGKVNPVKDQAQCGSCWAFATVLAVEGDYAVNKNTLLSLSEEQVVQCDYNNGDGNSGCDGGDQLTALKWLANQPGLCTEADYPYTSGGGTTGKCKKTCTPAVKIAEGVEVPKGNDTALMVAIANYPLSLSVDASDDAIWQSYSGGVVTGKCGTCKDASCLDHGVGGVGYGTDNGVDYWIVRNSWGKSWGEAGYIRLARGPAYAPAGQCGVTIDNQYSVGASQA